MWKDVLKRDEYSGLRPEGEPDVATIYPKKIEVKKEDGSIHTYKAVAIRMIEPEEYFAAIKYTNIEDENDHVMIDGLTIEMRGYAETLEGEDVGDIVSNHSSHDRGNVNLRWYDIERMPEF